jgi:hypothetical protein
MFQQTLWIGGSQQEDEGKKVDLAQVDDRGWVRKKLGP